MDRIHNPRAEIILDMLHFALLAAIPLASRGEKAQIAQKHP